MSGPTREQIEIARRVRDQSNAVLERSVQLVPGNSDVYIHQRIAMFWCQLEDGTIITTRDLDGQD